MNKETIMNYLSDSSYISGYTESIDAMLFYSIGCVSPSLWSSMILMPIGIYIIQKFPFLIFTEFPW